MSDHDKIVAYLTSNHKQAETWWWKLSPLTRKDLIFWAEKSPPKGGYAKGETLLDWIFFYCKVQKFKKKK